MNVNQKKLYPSVENEAQQTVLKTAAPEASTQNTAQKQAAASGQNGGYASKWQTGLDSTMDKILNREEFKFDLNGDALMKQYSDLYTMQGKKAMMDTMAQASALTGGYGSSYAQNAGQQAYQGYIQQMNDRIPELYQLALDKYSMEGEDLRNRYGLLAGLEEQDYGRYRDQLADDRYDQEFQYQQGRDQIEDERYDEQWEYQKDRDRIEDERWQAEFDEDKRRYDQDYEAENGSNDEGNPDDGPGGGDDPYAGKDLRAMLANAGSRKAALAMAEDMAAYGYEEEAYEIFADLYDTPRTSGSGAVAKPGSHKNFDRVALN